MPKISIIIINYNTAQLTFDCIESIYATTPDTVDFEIIVVDNASQYADFEALQLKLDALGKPDLMVFRSRINSGFGGGNMHGVQFATGDYLAFINSDVVLREDSFTPLLRYFDQHPDTGVMGILPVYEDDRKQVAFGHVDTFVNRFFGYWLYEKLNPKKAKRRGNYTEPIAVDYVVGSFMLFKAADFYGVGGFDTNLFLYFEEMDVCGRLKKIGKKTVFFPSIPYTHINGMSTKLGYVKKIELKVSHLYVVRKNYGFGSYLALKTFFTVQYFFKSLFSPKHFRLFFKLLFLGPPLAASIKHKQTIQPH